MKMLMSADNSPPEDAAEPPSRSRGERSEGRCCVNGKLIARIAEDHPIFRWDRHRRVVCELNNAPRMFVDSPWISSKIISFAPLSRSQLPLIDLTWRCGLFALKASDIVLNFIIPRALYRQRMESIALAC